MTRPEYQPGDRVVLARTIRRRDQVDRSRPVDLVKGEAFEIVAVHPKGGLFDYTLAGPGGAAWADVPETCLRPADGAAPPPPPPPRVQAKLFA